MFRNVKKMMTNNAGITIMLVPYNEKHIFRVRINYRIFFSFIFIVIVFVTLAIAFIVAKNFLFQDKNQIEQKYEAWQNKLWLYENSLKHIRSHLKIMKDEGEDLYRVLWSENYGELRRKMNHLKNVKDDSLLTAEFRYMSFPMKTVLHFLSQAEDTFHSLPLGWPVNTGFISSPYGDRPSPFGDTSSVFHSGYDFANGIGTPIMTTADGEVLDTFYDLGGYGTHVKILHKNGFITLYAHASELFVEKGDYVKKGDMIAKVGITGSSTGPHVHYEVRIQQKPPFERNEVMINPLPFISENL